MNSLEWRVTASLAAIYAVRMLGLFMILPVFALYAKTFPDSTPALAGLAIGIYGLSQAVFQIPLGIMADKIGRKPVIVGGLLVFAAGSVIAALADSMWWIIVGRTVQGMGAIAAATMALAADLIREENRIRTMGIIGLTIGMSFMAGMILGPFVSQFGGVPTIFWLTCVLALIGIALVLFVVPNPARNLQHRDAGIIKGYLGTALSNPALLRMNVGVFILHLVMTANFLVIPGIFTQELGLSSPEHWKIYLPVFVGSFLLSIPLILMAEKQRKIRPLLLLSTLALIVAEAVMAAGHAHMGWLLPAFLLFFIGFNFLEAVQPSLVVKYSAVHTKGTAMGIFGSSQFLGIFAGGSLGGMVNHAWGISGVFVFSALITLLWLLVALQLPQPTFYTSRILKLDPLLFSDPQRLHDELLAVTGVKEVAIAADECLAYLKVDKTLLDEESLRAFSGASA